TEEVLSSLQARLPILVWIDCDYYSSSRTVFERLIPYIPSGCVVYFDDCDFNFGSRFTGEARLIHEINHGAWGEGIELALDRNLSWDSNRIYRFIRTNGALRYEPVERKNSA